MVNKKDESKSIKKDDKTQKDQKEKVDNKKNKNKVSVDTDGCIGCGACVAICPNIFKFNENSKSYVAKQPETDEELECAKQAEAACPVMVIHVNDSND